MARRKVKLKGIHFWEINQSIIENDYCFDFQIGCISETSKFNIDHKLTQFNRLAKVLQNQIDSVNGI